MAKKTAVDIPQNANFTTVGGTEFVAVQAAARLGGLHPVALGMGKTLIKSVGSGGCSFQLATVELRRNADAIEAILKRDLRRVAKALEPTKKFKVKTHRETDRIVFWYSA